MTSEFVDDSIEQDEASSDYSSGNAFPTLQITVLTNLAAPYRVPLFDKLGQRPDINLRVLCMTDTQKNRPWEETRTEVSFSQTVLPGYSTHSFILDRSVAVNPSVISVLRDEQSDVLVVGGYSDATVWLALGYAKFVGIPSVIWLGSWEDSARVANPLVTWSKIKFVEQGDAWIAYGSKAADWIANLGGEPDRIFQATNTVDTEWFHKRAIELGSPPSDGAPLEVLYCGQLIPRKNVETLIEAIRDMNSESIRLRIIGDGPQREDLAILADEVAPTVTFEGYVDREQLPRYYGSADVLVLPSNREVWGLVVNEALSSGTAAVVSESCGSAADLVEPGFNGETFDPNDTTELRSILKRMVEQRGAYRERREEIAADVMKRASIENAAGAFASAVREAYERSGTR